MLDIFRNVFVFLTSSRGPKCAFVDCRRQFGVGSGATNVIVSVLFFDVKPWADIDFSLCVVSNRGPTFYFVDF